MRLLNLIYTKAPLIRKLLVKIVLCAVQQGNSQTYGSFPAYNHDDGHHLAGGSVRASTQRDGEAQVESICSFSDPVHSSQLPGREWGFSLPQFHYRYGFGLDILKVTAWMCPRFPGGQTACQPKGGDRRLYCVMLHAIRDRLVDAPGSAGERWRGRRWELLRTTFPAAGSMRVIDLGGRASAWLRSPVRPASVHIVNLEPVPIDLPEWITAEQGDACAPRRGDYDLVFCNSVIEHVGGHVMRQRLADAVRALAPRHWVQTPYRYFPIEPHWLFPGFQFLPVPAQAAITRHWPLGYPEPDRPASVQRVMAVELLSRTEMAAYFPGSVILTERAAGLAKSIIAVGDDPGVLR